MLQALIHLLLRPYCFAQSVLTFIFFFLGLTEKVEVGIWDELVSGLKKHTESKSERALMESIQYIASEIIEIEPNNFDFPNLILLKQNNISKNPELIPDSYNTIIIPSNSTRDNLILLFEDYSNKSWCHWGRNHVDICDEFLKFLYSKNDFLDKFLLDKLDNLLVQCVEKTDFNESGSFVRRIQFGKKIILDKIATCPNYQQHQKMANQKYPPLSGSMAHLLGSGSGSPAAAGGGSASVSRTRSHSSPNHNPFLTPVSTEEDSRRRSKSLVSSSNETRTTPQQQQHQTPTFQSDRDDKKKTPSSTNPFDT